MDPIEASKLRTAMKNHKLKSHRHLVYGFIPHLLTALTCSLLCSYPFWLPSIEHFLFITLRHVRASLLSPKCLFLVVNAIVAFLVGESKLGGLHSSASSHDEVYEEYVERSRTRKMLSTCAESEISRELEDERLTGDEVREEEEVEEVEEEKEVVVVEEEEEDQVVEGGGGGGGGGEGGEKETGDEGGDKQEAEQEQEEDDDDEEKDKSNVEEEDEIPAEELKKRVEEFIARVNRQRWLEARSLMCVH